ncbi:MAG: hypothetical protein RKP46_11885 [Candidatus Accumulibacter sp.]|uniref:hypothetical protein n=1 Tax=Accumulibacter sp. TaxID=2053492 RepID=UPI0028797E79|nr:hypothetical protein [Accumulibacter sp.]MDS4015031.1 hypothetical protein [Accumulibacter sp.]
MKTPTLPPRLLSPTNVTVVLSFMLSLVARLGSEVNRDGMLYIATAQAFLDGGFTAAKASFAWPFLSIAIALVAKITGLGLENAAYLLNALFMAGTCALIVACVSRRSPEIAWPAVLVVLSLPGVNEYRNELLREFGCWFFIALAWWLALRWEDRPRWTGAIAVQAALACAALFRPEALILYASLIAWQFFGAPRSDRWRRLAMIALLPLVAGVALLAAYFSGQLGGRLGADLGRFSLNRFDEKTSALAGSLIEYARGQARSILLFGSLALIPVKLVQKFGILLLPLAYVALSGNIKELLCRHALFAWGIVLHLLVLSIFVLDLQFLAGRYVGLILLLATPFIAAGLHRLIERYPRWRLAVFSAAVLLACANVISTGPGKGHFAEAGKWLATNAASSRVYIDSSRTAYHAGWSGASLAERNRREAIRDAIDSGEFDLFVLELSRKDPPWNSDFWTSSVVVLKRFESRNGDAVIIARPSERTPR